MKIALAALLTFLLASCVYSNKYEIGRDFPSSNVPQIVKGQTTADQLKELLGEPERKSVASDTDEHWIYFHESAVASAQAVTLKTETKGTRKSLDALLRNGVVTNYSFTEGPIELKGGAQ